MIISRYVNHSGLFQSFCRRLSLPSSDFRLSNNSQVYGLSICCAKSKDFDSSPKRSLSSGKKPILFSVSMSKAKNDHGASGSAHHSSSDPSSKHSKNRLALEKSPYLLQHATNPVDWYPWGTEAFEKAKAENKLIFLSVGYSTCHWCHVMEKESFENESVAEIMNKYFVNIKVDREERPDVDRMYMSFVQASTGSGGWPMSVFLTPDLEPLAGGTYFPPEDMFGRPGFKTVLLNIAKQWLSEGHTMLQSGKRAIEVLQKVSERDLTPARQIQVPAEDCAKKCVQQLTRSYEPEYGGFSNAPKFPQPSNFNFLFHVYSREKTSELGQHVLNMCLHTLKKMANGGIHDHINCGFARYSVDRKWHVPHFEKMLYDQAQLVVSYCDAYVVTKDSFYADIVRDILKYVSRDLSHPLGGFYGAEDADSYPHEGAKHKKEGAFCVWEYDEINHLITDKTHAEIFCYHYNVQPHGNVNPAQDPHHELKKKNVLVVFGSYEETAAKFDISVQKLKEILKRCCNILYDVRQKRPKPLVDTKIVTSWNGLMISGFARAGFVLKDQSYIDRAILAANFLRKYLYNETTKSLTRCCYRGDNGQITQTANSICGFLDDYAFLIKGLLDLYEASLDTDWLQWAESLQEQQDRLFWDADGAGYFTSPEGDSTVLIRGKEDQDGAEPCGNSIAVHNLIRLAVYLDRQDLRAKAGRILTSFSEKLSSIPIALPEMTSALIFYYDSPTQVFIAGKAEDNNTQALLDVLRTRLLPGRILAVADGPGGRAGLLYRRHESLARLNPVHGKSAAYVCRNFACSLPVTEPNELASNLDSEGKNLDAHPAKDTCAQQ